MAAEKELQAIAKELKELNRRLDRLCRASIFSIGEPAVSVKYEIPTINLLDEPGTLAED